MGSPTPTVAPNLLPLALPVCAALPLHRLQAALTEDDGAYISPISPLHLPYISPVSPYISTHVACRRRSQRTTVTTWALQATAGPNPNPNPNPSLNPNPKPNPGPAGYGGP